MIPRMKRNLLLTAVMLAAVFALACGGELDKANKLVNEGNTAITDGNKLIQDALAKNTQVMDGLTNDFPANKDSVRAAAQDAIKGFEQAAAKFREAAQKFDDASKLKVDDKFKEYLQLKSKEFSKNAEQADASKDSLKAVLESEDKDALRTGFETASARIEQLDKEAKALNAQAEKIRQDNKDKFQQ